MKTRFGVALMAAALLLYIVLVGGRAVAFVGTGDPVGIAMGAALIVLPVIAVWALGRELWFGVRAERLGKRLEAEGGLPDDAVHAAPSGRVDRADGEAVFPKYRNQVEDAPDDWRAWYRLGLAYDAAGDRRRAREAIRKSISLAPRGA
ncbi:tetratricopeptide repeat protein [Microbacterium halophytorum]|uniref:tetratricopeptide repeat protein n=1 Tax=Microbacterium halophytorum TaxID=2067568 RepID=UPI000CFB0DA6|nr:tetratricopeptide repeat protein [Microbacterium halophytorum]